MPPRSILPPPDAAALRAAALRYVARYAAHAGRLRRVLRARLNKAALQHPEWARDVARQAELLQTIEAIVREFAEKNYIDDAAFAASKAGALQRQGKSRRRVTAQLQAEGFAGEAIAQALREAQVGQTPEAAELAAAERLAQRKRLGRWRKGEADPATIRREYAALARAGFSAALARRIIQQEIDEELASE